MDLRRQHLPQIPSHSAVIKSADSVLHTLISPLIGRVKVLVHTSHNESGSLIPELHAGCVICKLYEVKGSRFHSHFLYSS